MDMCIIFVSILAPLVAISLTGFFLDRLTKKSFLLIQTSLLVT